MKACEHLTCGFGCIMSFVLPLWVSLNLPKDTTQRIENMVVLSNSQIAIIPSVCSQGYFLKFIVFDLMSQTWKEHSFTHSSLPTAWARTMSVRYVGEYPSSDSNDALFHVLLRPSVPHCAYHLKLSTETLAVQSCKQIEAPPTSVWYERAFAQCAVKTFVGSTRYSLTTLRLAGSRRRTLMMVIRTPGQRLFAIPLCRKNRIKRVYYFAASQERHTAIFVGYAIEGRRAPHFSTKVLIGVIQVIFISHSNALSLYKL